MPYCHIIGGWSLHSAVSSALHSLWANRICSPPCSGHSAHLQRSQQVIFALALGHLSYQLLPSTAFNRFQEGQKFQVCKGCVLISFTYLFQTSLWSFCETSAVPYTVQLLRLHLDGLSHERGHSSPSPPKPRRSLREMLDKSASHSCKQHRTLCVCAPIKWKHNENILDLISCHGSCQSKMLCFQTDSNPGTKTLQADLYDARLPCSRKWCLTSIASKVSICDSHESAFQDLLQVDFTEYWNTCSKALESQKATNSVDSPEELLRFNELLHDVFILVWSKRIDQRMAMKCTRPASTFHAGSTMRFCLYQLHGTVAARTLHTPRATRMQLAVSTGNSSWSKHSQVKWIENGYRNGNRNGNRNDYEGLNISRPKWHQDLCPKKPHWELWRCPPTGSPGSGKRTNMDFITWCSASKSCVSAKGTEIAPMMSIMSLYHKSKYIYIYCGWLCFWHVHIGIVCIKCELSDPLTTKSCRRQTQEAGKNLDQRHQKIESPSAMSSDHICGCGCYGYECCSEPSLEVGGQVSSQCQ